MANSRYLDLIRKGSEFWNEWRDTHPPRKIDLDGANLIGGYLRKFDLSNVILGGATFIESDLREADLRGAKLDHTDFGAADLSGADLSGADLSGASLTGTILSNANLSKATLSHANLFASDLDGADLSEANLREADLSEAYLRRANFYKATLVRANLKKAKLLLADLSEANLREADLSEAYLSGAILVGTNLTEATLNNCLVYGISTWGIQLEGAKQDNLIITPLDQPTITVDNLKVAQFIYLLLNNKEIRDVIDTITSKVVLILGRFTEERKQVLDALREELRNTHDFTPVEFDFDPSKNQDVTETVSTLAHLSRFIIADLTDPSSVPHELATIAPHCIRPIKPIILDQPMLMNGQERERHEYALFRDLRRRYDWVMPIYRYHDTSSLIASIKEQIISLAEQKAQELAQR